MNLFSVPILQDNYVWILSDDNNQCLIVDPGKSIPVLQFIKKNKLNPKGIFLTHHHNDHVEGVLELHSLFPHLVVYGPKEAKDKGVTKTVNGGETLQLLGRKFFIFSTPGHTLGHICFFSFPYLFCGDTLFSGGCGKIFEGTPNQMYYSLQKINQFPGDTIICCAHEYTLENMKFAISLLPEHSVIKEYYSMVSKLRKNKKKTLPVMLQNERKINLFLQVNDITFFKKIFKEKDLQSPQEYFAWLRFMRDCF